MPTPTLTTLHRVATHVLARRRFEVSGRFGLRASPGGMATPAFGDGPEVIRLSGPALVRETGGTSASVPVAGSTLRALAAFCGSDIATAFSCGDDTPPVGDPDEPLVFDTDEWAQLAEWYTLGTRALDTVSANGGSVPVLSPATIQLWPEHLDVGTTVTVGDGHRVNLGFSPGDGYEAEPYAYVGPWEAEHRGDAAFWNAPFGAVLRAAEVAAGADRLAACVTFLVTGLTYAAS